MRSYQEHHHKNYTLEIFQYPEQTIIKLFDLEKEVFKMEYATQTPIVVDCINSLIKLMQDDIYQHN